LVLAQAKRDSEAERDQFEQDALRDFDADPFGKMDRDEIYAASSSDGVFGSGYSEITFGYFNSLRRAVRGTARSAAEGIAARGAARAARPRPGRGTTLTLLAALGAGKSLKHHLQAMRDQTRVRIHVYEIKAATPPAIGSQDTADVQARLVQGLKAIVVLPLPRLPPPPLHYPVRPAHAAPTAEATALDMQHTGRISEAITQLMHLAPAGSFKADAARSKNPRRSALARAPPPPVPRARSATHERGHSRPRRDRV
jgi:hypothetical protein